MLGGPHLFGVLRGPHLCGVLRGPHLFGVLRGPHLCGVLRGPHLFGVLRGPHLCGVLGGPHLFGVLRGVDLPPRRRARHFLFDDERRRRRLAGRQVTRALHRRRQRHCNNPRIMFCRACVTSSRQRVRDVATSVIRFLICACVASRHVRVVSPRQRETVTTARTIRTGALITDDEST